MTNVHLMTRTPEGSVIKSELAASMDTFLQTMDELGAVYNEVLNQWETDEGADYWPADVLTLSTDTLAAGRQLGNAARDAMADFMDTLDNETRSELMGFEAQQSESFEYVAEAADAVYAEYQLESDQTIAQMAEVSIFDVRNEAGHRPIRATIWTDAHMTAHVAAYESNKRNVALVKGLARKAKARRYHDISAIVLGKDGKVLGRSKQATAHLKAKAEDFKAATRGLTQAQMKKVRRYMAKHSVTVQEALAAF